MKLRNLLATAITLVAATAFAAEGNFDKTLTVSGQTNLSISTGSGYVHVFPGSDNQVHIIGRVHVRTGLLGGTDAESTLKHIVDDPPISQSGNSITVSNLPGNSGLFRNVSIDYEVTTPSTTTLKVRAGSGTIEIGGIEGTVDAGSGSGSINVENIGANARLATGSGHIHAAKVHGGATLQTGSGGVELSVTGPGDVKAGTGSGSISIDGVSGGLRASAGSGSIHVSGDPAGEWRIESGSGSIRVQTPQNARFNVNAETGSGGIRVDHPIVMQGSMNKHHVVGAVNGGGPTIRTSTGSGSITLD